jgi:hypothetical protein
MYKLPLHSYQSQYVIHTYATRNTANHQEVGFQKWCSSQNKAIWIPEPLGLTTLLPSIDFLHQLQKLKVRRNWCFIHGSINPKIYSNSSFRYIYRQLPPFCHGSSTWFHALQTWMSNNPREPFRHGIWHLLCLDNASINKSSYVSNLCLTFITCTVRALHYVFGKYLRLG